MPIQEPDGAWKVLGTNPYSQSENSRKLKHMGLLDSCLDENYHSEWKQSKEAMAQTGSTASPISDSTVNYWFFFL
jgi:hypothetical protein